MKSSVLDKQIRAFTHLREHVKAHPDNDITLELKNYLASYPIASTLNKYTDIPPFFHKRYIVANVRGHYQKIDYLIKSDESAIEKDVLQELEYALLWLEQVRTIAAYVELFTSSPTTRRQDIQSMTLSPQSISKGDIILSYKTRPYLRRSLKSTAVRIVTNSQMTHVMLAIEDPSPNPRFLVSGDETQGLGLVPLELKDGEIYLVMSPKKTNEKLFEQIDLWTENAVAHMHMHGKFKFPELKCQAASIIGILTILMIYLGRPLNLKNPLANLSGLFCSELIDTIFKESGILLSPRSEYDATIPPVELFYSPRLTFKGVIAKQDELEKIQSEIRSHFSPFRLRSEAKK